MLAGSRDTVVVVQSLDAVHVVDRKHDRAAGRQRLGGGRLGGAAFPSTAPMAETQARDENRSSMTSPRVGHERRMAFHDSDVRAIVTSPLATGPVPWATRLPVRSYTRKLMTHPSSFPVVSSRVRGRVILYRARARRVNEYLPLLCPAVGTVSARRRIVIHQVVCCDTPPCSGRRPHHGAHGPGQRPIRSSTLVRLKLEPGEGDASDLL